MPHAHEADGPLRIHVVTVSTSRGAAEDRSGPLIRELAIAKGHNIAGHAIVPDDPGEIGVELDRALDSPSIDVVILTGGTGISARDCTPAVVRERLDRELPGFGEFFRTLSFDEIGPAAMLSNALAGLAHNRPVFAIPGSTAACRLAMTELILPLLPHIAGELRKESPLPRKHAESVKPVVRARVSEDRLPEALSGPPRRALAPSPTPAIPVSKPAWGEPLSPAAALEPPRKGIDVTTLPDVERPAYDDVATGWMAFSREVDGRVLPFGNAEIPDALARIPAVMDVLGSGASRARLRARDGREWLLFGFPDLTRPGAKVIAVREALPVAEIVALHRWPQRVGVCAEVDDGPLPKAGTAPEAESNERTGRAYEGEGTLFAVDASIVYVQERRWVRRWDGKKLGPEDNVGSALGTLILGWSQR